MQSTRAVALIGVALPVVALTAGCGGNGEPGSTVASPQCGVRIEEYVGDGHNGTKPWPAFLGLPGPDTALVGTQALATPLAWNAPCRASYVRVRNAHLWLVDPVTAPTSTCHVITLQPLENEDSDLYINQYGTFASWAHCARVPDAGSDRIKGAYAPDWCAIWLSDTGGLPAAHVFVDGLNTGGATKRFSLEADVAGRLAVNGASRCGSLAVGNSCWYYFPATGGAYYTLTLAAISGDPEAYVYDQTAYYYVTRIVSAGGGSAAFHPGLSHNYFVRVYAYTTCRYAIRLTSP